MKYIGGYSILDLTDANVSAQANACYNQDKPVLVYGANGEKFFADTITKDGTSIVVTKGGKTITIASDNTITNVGDIQSKKKYFHNICIINPETNNYPSVLNFVLVNERSTPYTSFSDIQDYFKNNINDKIYGANGLYFASKTGDISATKTNVYVKYDQSRLANYTMDLTNRNIDRNQLYNQIVSVSDYVVEL